MGYLVDSDADTVRELSLCDDDVESVSSFLTAREVSCTGFILYVASFVLRLSYFGSDIIYSVCHF